MSINFYFFIFVFGIKIMLIDCRRTIAKQVFLTFIFDSTLQLQRIIAIDNRYEKINSPSRYSAVLVYLQSLR